MTQITIIAHNIRSTHNIGSIFRSAEGFGVKCIICTGYTPYPDLSLTSSNTRDTRLPHIREKLTKQIHKTALGAEALVPFKYFQTLESWVQHNNNNDKLPIIALEQSTDSISLQDYTPPDNLALLIGEEVHGIEPHYLDSCESVLEIPMVGKKESFNVSVATGIALFHLVNA